MGPLHTSAEEDYLKEVLKLELAGEAPTTGTLAERIGVRPASVTGMLQRLAKRRLVRYQPYRAVELTDDGRRTAVATLRRHRLIELFLLNVLGFSWDQVHAEAERWEHAVSEEAVGRMDALLGRPSRDPHGAPIPTMDGLVPAPRGVSLAEAQVGERYRIAQIPDDDPALLGYLEQVGLLLDVSVDILEVEPAAEMITISVKGVRQEVARPVGRRIRVERVEGKGPDPARRSAVRPTARRPRAIGTRRTTRDRPVWDTAGDNRTDRHKIRPGKREQ